ncbi:MAG: diadenylate cyclase CdaA [Clostridia bacterium]|nr:diadenylate cyclase CdaA [Clostridia bacterium]
MAEFFGRIWDRVVGLVSSINVFTSLLDIVVVAVLLYAVFKLVRDSRAEQLVKGIILFLLLYVVARICRLTTLLYIMNFLLTNALILLAVIFQPELRRALERAGRTRVGGDLFNFGLSNDDLARNARVDQSINAVCDGLELLQRQKMGALVVFERSTRLGEVMLTGTELNAEPSAELVGTLFFNKSPLHDGAIILRDGKIAAAGCILPLSDNPQIQSELGTRHRAAVGMSENSDAVVLVLSEETGELSLAVSGVLKPNYSHDSLRLALRNMLLEQDLSADKKRWFQRGRQK